MIKNFSVTFLGSGTSSGIPCLGVEYSDEYLSVEKNHRLRSSILVQSNEGNLLIDATPDMRTQLLREEISSIDKVIITHTHADHVLGMNDLRGLNKKDDGNMDIYTLPVHQEGIRQLFPYAFRKGKPGVWLPKFTLHDVEETMRLCGLNVETMKVEHGEMDVVSIRIDDFAYVTDVSYIPPEAWNKLQNLDTLVLGAVRHTPHPNHFNFEQGIDVVNKLKPRMTYFTHIADEINHHEDEAKLPNNIRLAYDGLKLIF